uniref:Uncharacterized protein n=1 Tax=Anguilla anguilla TaxID=7936 RepID=A0A0E9WL41_ANGAN
MEVLSWVEVKACIVSYGFQHSDCSSLFIASKHFTFFSSVFYGKSFFNMFVMLQ